VLDSTDKIELSVKHPDPEAKSGFHLIVITTTPALHYSNIPAVIENATPYRG
jgi:TusA-related sulfurtransferase